MIVGCSDNFCDTNERWIKGYVKEMHSEMWREQFNHLIAESDSKTLIDMIPNNFKLNGNIPILVHHI